MDYLKILFAIIKFLFAVGISPILLLLFFYWNKAFLFLMSKLWPNLSILDENRELYLRRFFLSPKTKYFRPLFLHYIAKSDAGRNPHSHPGKFDSYILKGGYVESIYYPKNVNFRKQKGLCEVKVQLPGTKLSNPEGHTHMVELLAPTWTLVLGWLRGKPWYFWVLDPVDANNDYAIESNSYGNKGIEIKSWQ